VSFDLVPTEEWHVVETFDLDGLTWSLPEDQDRRLHLSRVLPGEEVLHPGEGLGAGVGRVQMVDRLSSDGAVGIG